MSSTAPVAAAEPEEVLHDLDVVLRGEGLVLERGVQPELDVHLQPADAAEVVFLGVEEQVVEEVVGALHRVGLAGAELAVDLGQGLVGVLAEVLLQGVDHDHTRRRPRSGRRPRTARPCR